MNLYHVDTGNCRVYYKDRGQLLCYQAEPKGWGLPVFALFACTKDCEPSHQVATRKVPQLQLPEEAPGISGEVRQWLINEGLAIPEYTCKFCGAASGVDPSDQSPPPDYCHESDHQFS